MSERVVELPSSSGRTAPEFERTPPQDRRHVARVPPALAQEHILARVEAEQRERAEAAAIILAEHDGIVALRLLEAITGGPLDYQADGPDETRLRQVAHLRARLEGR